MYVLVNDRLVAAGEAKTDMVSDGLYYGAGCFETLRGYNGQFLHLDKHIARLNEAIEYLTGSDFRSISEPAIRKSIRKLLNQNGLQNEQSKVRIQVSLDGRHGYSEPLQNETTLKILITAERLAETIMNPLSLVSTNVRVVPSACKPAHLKLSNMLHYRQAGIDAGKQGADDAVMCTINGNVAETSIANLFWEKDGVVCSPSEDCDILPGIMREIMIRLCDKMGIEYRLAAYRPEVLQEAAQVWVTNSVREMNWVKSIDGTLFKTNTTLKDELEMLFVEYKRNHLK